MDEKQQRQQQSYNALSILMFKECLANQVNKKKSCVYRVCTIISESAPLYWTCRQTHTHTHLLTHSFTPQLIHWCRDVSQTSARPKTMNWKSASRRPNKKEEHEVVPCTLAHMFAVATKTTISVLMTMMTTTPKHTINYITTMRHISAKDWLVFKSPCVHFFAFACLVGRSVSWMVVYSFWN